MKCLSSCSNFTKTVSCTWIGRNGTEHSSFFKKHKFWSNRWVLRVTRRIDWSSSSYSTTLLCVIKCWDHWKKQPSSSKRQSWISRSFRWCQNFKCLIPRIIPSIWRVSWGCNCAPCSASCIVIERHFTIHRSRSGSVIIRSEISRTTSKAWRSGIWR